jgi:LCP family protein required for cell wall assembly
VGGIFIFGACSVPIGALVPGVSNAPEIIVTLDPNAGPTATPFAPLSPTDQPEFVQPAITPTPIPDPASPWLPYPGPVEPSAIDIPFPAPILEMSPDVINILLLGSDLRPNTGGYRTDTMMILSLDPLRGTATLVSIPRDLYVYIPGWRVDRINTADIRGGFEMTSQTILYNFGIQVRYFARVNFAGFINAVNALGGITVQVTDELFDECGGRYWRYVPGSYEMDGFQSLCYVRMRKSGGDFDRLRRQQEVVRALFNRVLSLDGLSQIPDLYAQYKAFVVTNMTQSDMLPLIPLGIKLAQDSNRIRQFRIDESMVTYWRVPYSGASVLLPDHEAIQSMLEEAFLASTEIE